jgi:hypothetical protein
MPKRITLFVAGVFVCLLAAFALTTLSGRAVRAADCITEPNADSPPGSHWYYHLDRASNRKCWNLRPQGSNQVALPVPLPSPKPISQPTAETPAELPTTKASAQRPMAGTPAEQPATKTPDAATAGENTRGSALSMRRTDQPKPVESIDREPASMSNRDADERSKTDLQDQVPLISPALTAAAAEQEPESAFVAPLACALVRTGPLSPKGVPPPFAGTVATTRHAEIVRRPPEPSDLEIEETLRQFLRAWEHTAA